MRCRKYGWVHNTPLNEVNFFGHTTSGFVEVDLQDFYIMDSLRNVDYKFEGIDNVTKALYITASSTRLQVNNIKEYRTGKCLDDFFELYEPNPYIRFKFDLIKDGETIYSGIIYPDKIKMNDRIRDVIDITVLGWEVEFKTYYSNKTLAGIEGVLHDLSSLVYNQVAFLYSALKENFPAGAYLNYNMESALRLYLISYRPYFYWEMPGFTNNHMFFKNGYTNFQRDLINRFDWFNSLCLSMGWVWFFYLNKFNIKKRASLDFPLLTLDYNNTFITHNITKSVHDLAVDNILINDGYFGGNPLTGTNAYGLDLKGTRNCIYSALNSYHNNTNPWKHISWHHDPGGVYNLNVRDHNFMIKDSETDYNYNFKSHYVKPDGHVTTSSYAFGKRQTLFINPVINSINKSRIDLGNPWYTDLNAGIWNGNSYYNDEELSTYDMSYYGNPANSIFRTTGSSSYETYQDYIKTVTFYDNFKKFLRSNVQVVFDVTVGQLITNPLQTIKITNYPFYNLNNKTFAIIGLSYDPFKETSNLKLQML